MSTPFLDAIMAEFTKHLSWNMRALIFDVYKGYLPERDFETLQANLLAEYPDADRLALAALLDLTGRQQGTDRLPPSSYIEGDGLPWLLAAWVVKRPAPSAAEAVAAALHRLADPWQPGLEPLVCLLAAVAGRLGAPAPSLAAPFRERLAQFLRGAPGTAVDYYITNRAWTMVEPLRPFLGEDAEGLPLLEEAVRQFPLLLHHARPPAYAAVINRFLAEMPADNLILNTALASYHYPAGIDHLLAACRQLERFGPKPPLTPYFDEYKEKPLVWPTLWCVRLAPPTASDKARAAELGAFKPDTLLVAALLSPAWAPLLEPLLDWPGLAALVGWLYAHGETEHWRYHRPGGKPADEEEAGGADREAAVEAITRMGEQRWQKLRKHPVAKGKYRDGLFLAQACLGENAADVEAGFLKRNKLAVRALGLLPDEGDILQRYLALRRFIKETKQFGAMRQASETTAAEDGLANLAATAGYPDPAALEWAMEGELAQELDPTSRRWNIGEYIVYLLPDAKATIAVERGGKPVKSVPPAVRQDAAYLEIKEARELLQAQWQRIQRRLEFAMARGERFDRAAFAPALTTPAGRAMTPHLVLRVWVGDTPVDTLNHTTLTGEAIDPTAITHYQVVHPLDLAKDGTLKAWQQALKSKEQPFPQVHRELYTRPEQVHLTHGRPVRLGALAERLRRAGWHRGYEEGFYRRLSGGTTASLHFADGVAIQSATDILTCESLAFYGTAPDPRAFSELVRDADLATAAAAPPRPAI